jgi:hypothetical protein
MEVTGQIHVPSFYPRRKKHWYLRNSNLYRLLSRFGRLENDKNLLPPPGSEAKSSNSRPDAEQA